nr:transposase domain-containing protein [Pseudomonas juntendi]
MFTVERHARGKWACRQYETLIQAPVPPQVIDKGIPTAGLLAHVMVAQFADHLPLYRQEKIFGLAGLAIPRSAHRQQSNREPDPAVGAWAVELVIFAGSLRSGKRAAAIMSLIQSARINGHDPYAYLKDVLTRLPTQRASEIKQLLPHQWMPV